MGAIIYYIFYGINWIITLLPLRILYIFSDLLYLLLYYFPSYRRKVVATNLKNSFPEKTEEELKCIEKKFYRHLADLFIEILKLTHMPKAQLMRRCTISNAEILDKLFKEKRDIIAVLGHYNNWEWLTIIPEYTKSFFIRAFFKAGGSLHERKDGFVVIDSVPYKIRSIAGEDAFRRSYGYLLRAYPKITFDKDIAFKNSDAEFVSFGHPLFEVMLDWVERSFSADLMKGSTFMDPTGSLSGHLLFYEGEITDGTGEVAGRKIFAYHVNDDNQVRCISSAILWDLADAPIGAQLPSGLSTNIEAMKNVVFQASVTELEKYLSQLQEERERQAQVKIK
ncbi:hypothetical protein MUO98_06515, partial [Candidatus Bathyarchaeota archaeon]|nr:hypothetical protein [Candidatus Bathyarchaeota archaeon]